MMQILRMVGRKLRACAVGGGMERQGGYRRYGFTTRRYAFVLNKGGTGAGRLCGTDFEGATLSDALTDELTLPVFPLTAFGYRILEIHPE